MGLSKKAPAGRGMGTGWEVTAARRTYSAAFIGTRLSQSLDSVMWSGSVVGLVGGGGFDGPIPPQHCFHA